MKTHTSYNEKIVDKNCDSKNIKESTESRVLRQQLRLSNQWIVKNKEITVISKEYSDEFPDLPDTVFSEYGRIGNKENGISKIFIEPNKKRKKKYRCPNCGCLCKPHEYKKREYHHIPDLGYKCILYVKVPKLKCNNCNSYPQIRFPAAKSNVSYTKELEKTVLNELKDNSLLATAEKLGIGRWIVSSILKNNVHKTIPEQDLSDVTMIYIDEIQFGKGHNYVTIFVDNTQRVIFMVTGKGKDTIEKFVNYLCIQGGHPDNIRVVSADMSRAYEGGVMDYLPNATLVFDRFHLVQEMNNDINNIRKRTLKRYNDENQKNIKFTVLKRESNYDDIDRERIERIRLSNPVLALATDMKEAFCRILECPDKESAIVNFKMWFQWVFEEGCDIMKTRAKRIIKKIDRILAWFDHKVNNGVIESINSRLKKTKSQACGYRNLTNFVNICLFRHGKLVIRI